MFWQNELPEIMYLTPRLPGSLLRARDSQVPMPWRPQRSAFWPTTRMVRRTSSGGISEMNRIQVPIRCKLAFALSPMFLSSIASQYARAEDAVVAPALKEIVVTGTRRADRTVLTSTVPVDVISGKELSKSGFSDTIDLLRQQVVSLNVQRFNVNDGAAFVRPFSLRGLPPDESLVLIDGKRMHRSAVIEVSNQPLARGAQGPDLAVVPSIAVKDVQVLRDGASAQYGSDAIAGVIDFQLRNARHGATLSAQGGQYYAGDGGDYRLQGTFGLPLPTHGFLDTSFELVRSEITSRGTQRPDAQALINAGNTAVPVPANRWGNPDLQAARMFFNSGVNVTDTVEAYAFGNYSWSAGETGFFWRNPTNNPSIFSSVPLTDQPGGPRFSFLSRYPGGFTPIFGSRITDRSIVGGIKGAASIGLKYDLSASLGESDVFYRIRNTINPSLGPDSPTSFRDGTLRQRETNVNFDGSFPWALPGLPDPLTVAFGLEHRQETFIQEMGDLASWEAGPFGSVIDPDTGKRFGLAVGSSGFPGFGPLQAGAWSRTNSAAYIDLEGDLTSRLTAGLAARYEDFSDFGSTTNWKASARFAAARGLAFRGSVSTGFRAPTPGQSHYSDSQTNIQVATGQLLFTGTLAPIDPISRYFGAKSLKPEDSFNLSGGIVLGPFDGFVATVDYFNIAVKNRIGVTANIPLTAQDVAALTAAGVADATSFQQIRFFGNFFDSRTQGVDAVVTQTWALDAKSSLSASATINYTRPKVTRILDSRAIDRVRKTDLEQFDPHWRGNFALDYRRGSFSGMIRTDYYGSWLDAQPNPANPSDTSFDQRFGAKWLVDLALTYDLDEHLSVTVGGDNIFNTFPTKDTRQGQKLFGIVYPQFSPFGYNGGDWYVRATASF